MIRSEDRLTGGTGEGYPDDAGGRLAHGRRMRLPSGKVGVKDVIGVLLPTELIPLSASCQRAARTASVGA
jgi:hypothetical protein